MKPCATVEFLDELKSRFKLTSDYKLAKLLQVHQTSISNYRKGKTFLSPEIALKVGALLEISPGYILACVEEERAERTNRPLIRDAWHEVARAIAPTPQTSNPTDRKPRDGVYYVKQRRYYGNIPRTWRVAPPRRFSPSPKNTPSMILA